MPWTTPKTWVSELVTAAMLNTEIRDRMILLKTSIDDLGNLSLGGSSVLSIAGDAATPTLNLHFMETEGGAGTDNLSTLTIAGSIRSGHLLLLTANNLAHIVTVIGGGNIVLNAGSFALTSGRVLALWLNGTQWFEVARSDRSNSSATGESLTSPTITSAAITDSGLTRPNLLAYREQWQSPAIAAGVLTINYNSGNHVLVTLNQNITSISVTNLPASGFVAPIVVYYFPDGVQRTITHTLNSVAARFPGNVAPTMTSTNGKIDRIVYSTHDAGTTWLADIIAQNY